MQKSTLLASLMLLILPGSGFAADELKLTLSDAVRNAAEKNLDVKIEQYNPAQYDADIERNRGIYDPVLALQTSYGADATKWSSSVDIDQFYINSSLSQLFWTGGTASLSFSNSFTGTSTTNRWQSKLGASVTQPLLKNTGRDATEINITVSKLSKYASLEKLKNRVLNVVAQARTEYFKLYTARKQLEVKKVSLELAKKILDETKARVAVGLFPAMEILNAEYGVVTREKEVIEAEKGVRDQNDVLSLILQLGTNAEIEPATPLDRSRVSFIEKDAVATALLRPDIRELKRGLEVNDAQLRLYKNRLMPDLSISASAGITGQDRTVGGDWEKLGTVEHPVWSVGLNLTYPFGNSASENDYRKGKLKSDQIALQIKSAEESVVNEIRATIRSVEAAYKQIDAADRGVAFAEERLKAFTKKNEVGLATTKDLLDVENDLATARIGQITALVNYNIAVTTHLKSTGELLQKENITVVEGDSEKLYKGSVVR